MLFHRTVLLAALLLALLACVPCGAADEVVSTVLPSGMKVIVREGHVVNLVAVDIWVRGYKQNTVGKIHTYRVAQVVV